MESTPVSRASLETRCGGIRLQSCPSTLSLDAVGLVFLFFTSAEWQSQRAMPTTFFLCFSQDSYGMPVYRITSRVSRIARSSDPKEGWGCKLSPN
jgi:hypothetical protein